MTFRLTDPVGYTDAARVIGFNKADHFNASAILFDNLQRNPDNLAIIGPKGQLNYRQLCAEASRWGHAFVEQGLERGDRIAFLLDDTPTYPAAFFGAVRAGFVPVLLNTQIKPELLQFFLEDSLSKVAICEADLADDFKNAIKNDSELSTVVIANGATGSDPGFIGAEQFISDKSETLECADTDPDDMAFWMYSSGSTGNPKGIVHLQHDMAYTAQSFSNNILHLKSDDICFSVPKIFFAYGFGNSFTFPFSVGAASVLMPGRPEAGRVLDTIETYQPSVFFGLPTLYTALCRNEGAQSRNFSSLRLCLSAAETLSEEIFHAWKKLTGLEAVEGLGSTELLHIYLSNTSTDRKLGSAGKAVPGYDIILKDNDGLPVASGEEGVMWVRGDSSLPSYWQRPDKTAETVRDDWVYTGDRFVEQEGYYYFQGRADDLIKVSGQWVWPLEVERCLAEHPDIHECAVLAHELPDKRLTLRAIICLRGEKTVDDTQTKRLQNHVRSALLPHKYPRIIEYVDELPKTGTGKIDRQKLSDA